MRNILALVMVAGLVWLSCDSNNPAKPPSKIPIAISSPTMGSTVSDTVLVTAAVGSGYTFSRVDFYIDGDSVYSDPSSPFTFKWYTGNYFDYSWHILKAVAYDGDVYESDTFSVRVIIPGGAMAIINPADGALLSGQFRFIVREAPAYSLERIAFFINTDSVGFDTSAHDTTIGVPVRIFETTIDAADYPDNSILTLQAWGYWPNDTLISSQISIYAIANPEPDTFEYLSSFTMSTPALRVAAVGGWLFVAAGSSGIYSIDAFDPTDPVLAFLHDTPGQARGVDAYSFRIYAADGDQGVFLLDYLDTVLSAFNTSGQSRNVKYSDSLLFVADYDGLQILVVRNDSLISKSRVALTGGQVKDVDAISSVAFVIDNSGLTVVDASSPTSPQVKSRYTGFDGIGQAVSAIDSFVFVGTTAELLKLSISDIDTVRFISRFANTSGVTGVFATDSVVFASLGGSNGGAMALTFRQAAPLNVINQYINSDNCHDICASGPFVYLAGQTKIDILRFVR